VVFRIQAHLRFATAAARTAGRTTIANAISGRNTTVVMDGDVVDGDGVLALVWEATEADTGDAGTIYALIQAMTAPRAGSRVHHHTCFHGNNNLPCIKTAEKVW
jgi:hypothetical protein